jgi:hypothetical protein
MSLEQQLSDAISAQNALTQAVAGKMGQIDQAVQQKKDELEAWRVASVGKLPTINLMRDSGRFFDIDAVGNAGNRRSTNLSAAFAAPALGLYSTSAASVGKFIHDNTTNGGTGGALTQPVIDLMNANGTAGARYGQEFYVAELTAGAVSVSPITVEGRNLSLACAIGATATGLLTFMSWFRCITGSVHLDVISRKNGSAPQSQVLLPSDGWKHLAGNSNWGRGYSIVHIRCEQNSKFQMAMPAMLLGDYVGKVHSAPLPAFEY